MRKDIGVMVKVLDFGAITKVAQEKYAEDEDLPLDMVEAYVSGKTGYVEINGDKFLLDDEGIILTKPVSDENFISKGVYLKLRKEAGSDAWSMPLIPKFNINLKPSVIDELEIKEEEPLLSFVRTFGSRLENNYDGCIEVLEAKIGEANEVVG